MSDERRLVYSTDVTANQRCPRCRALLEACTCAPPEAVPAKGPLTVKLRTEKSGRGGKTVTVLYDLPRNPTYLKDLATRLKKALGTGGTAREDGIELQGDYRERLRALLPTLGFRVK